MTYAEIIALVRVRLRWLRGKTAQYEAARRQYRDIPPLAIDVSRIILPVTAILTYAQRRNAQQLLPFVRELKSAATRLDQMMQPATQAAANPPLGTPPDSVTELRALIAQSAAALVKAQDLLAEWAESPAYFHPGRVPRWQAYVFGDPAGVHVDMDSVESAIVGPEYVAGQQREERQQELTREARQEQAAQAARQRIEQAKQPGPLVGFALGFAALGLAYLWIRRRG